MKKWMTFLLTAAIVILCVGCGAGKNTNQTVSMYDLRTAMEAADPDLPEMLNASSTEKDAEDITRRWTAILSAIPRMVTRLMRLLSLR